jgi:hypothetical protein
MSYSLYFSCGKTAASAPLSWHSSSISSFFRRWGCFDFSLIEIGEDGVSMPLEDVPVETMVTPRACLFLVDLARTGCRNMSGCGKRTRREGAHWWNL